MNALSQPETYVDQSTVNLCFRIRNDHPNAQFFSYYLEYLIFHMPNRLIEPGLRWLIRNRLTGDGFIYFVKGQCAESGLELIRYLTMRLEREKRTRTLYAADVQ